MANMHGATSSEVAMIAAFAPLPATCASATQAVPAHRFVTTASTSSKRAREAESAHIPRGTLEDIGGAAAGSSLTARKKARSSATGVAADALHTHSPSAPRGTVQVTSTPASPQQASTTMSATPATTSNAYLTSVLCDQFERHHPEPTLMPRSVPSINNLGGSAATGASAHPAGEHTGDDRLPRAQQLDWRAQLNGAAGLVGAASHAGGPHACAACVDYLDFALIQRCASSWSLQPRVLHLVRQYNDAGEEAALVEFTRLRAAFIRLLVHHLNRFWTVIAGSANSKTTLAERGAGGRSGDLLLRTKSSFRDAHADKMVLLWTLRGLKEHCGTITLASELLPARWFVSPDRRTCSTIEFDPKLGVDTAASSVDVGPSAAAVSAASASAHATGHPLSLTASPPTICNLWRGYAISRDTAMRPTTAEQSAGLAFSPEMLCEAIEPFLEHVRTICCRSDAKLYTFVIGWMASVVQRPWHKLGVALVLLGDEGSGKSVLLNQFLGHIVGSHHFSAVTGLEPVCGPFNGTALATACLVFIDEASVGSKQYAAKLKTLITEPHHIIVNKYAPSLRVRSFTNFVLASNEEHVVDVDTKARRFCVLHTDNRWSGSGGLDAAARAAYFDRLVAVPVHLVARYLYQYDLTGFDPRCIPTSDMQRTQKRLSMEANSVARWLLQRIESQSLPCPSSNGPTAWLQSSALYGWTQPRPKAAVYEDYRAQAGSAPKPVESFWRQLREIVPYLTVQKRSNGASTQLVHFPPLTECEAAFRKHVADPDWPFEAAGGDEARPDMVDTASGAQDQNQAAGSSSSSGLTSAQREAMRRSLPLDAPPCLSDYDGVW